MKFKIPKFLKKKRNLIIIAIIIIIIVGGYLVFGRKNNTNSIQTGFATKQNLQETVLSTGQVVSKTDLSLSFQGSGVARRVLVKEGDQVYKGQLLASLDSGTAYGSLLTAQGALAQAEANYEKIISNIAGKTSSDQDLANAYSSAKNALDAAYTAIFNAKIVADSVRSSYFTTADTPSSLVWDSLGDINSSFEDLKNLIAKNTTNQGIEAAVNGAVLDLAKVTKSLTVIREQCNNNFYKSLVSAADKTSLDAQRGYINTASINILAAQSGINSTKIGSQKSVEDVDIAKAQILSAQGQVASAQASLNNSQIVAPENGTITQVDIRVGELATAGKEVIVLQNISDLHAEADVSEANVASLQLGQSIDYTFDALGPDKHFTGKILTINPASTVISGVVNYKVTGSFDNVPNIKPGMTANMTILVAKKDNVLSVPSTAIINKNNKQYVRVIDNPKNKTYHEVLVQTGLQADGGLIEIISGLNDGQEIVTYIKP